MSKLYFYEGDTVKLKQDIPNSPEMIVEVVDKIKVTPESRPTIMGIRCYWFTSEGFIQKNRFDFKDLKIIKRATEYAD